MFKLTNKRKSRLQLKLKAINDETNNSFFLFVIAVVVRSEAFASQVFLERIDLRYNRISSIGGGAFGGLNEPKEIYLAGNRLIQLNSDVFEVWF